MITDHLSDEQAEHIIQCFRDTFSSEHGQVTLGVILHEAGFLYPDIQDLIGIGKRNLAAKILQYMGVKSPVDSNEFVEAFTEAIRNVSITKKRRLRKNE